jgi:hypothetical protein
MPTRGIGKGVLERGYWKGGIGKGGIGKGVLERGYWKGGIGKGVLQYNTII